MANYNLHTVTMIKCSNVLAESFFFNISANFIMYKMLASDNLSIQIWKLPTYSKIFKTAVHVCGQTP